VVSPSLASHERVNMNQDGCAPLEFWQGES
jgi:hypothetical protein